jgi:hypothetical protein
MLKTDKLCYLGLGHHGALFMEPAAMAGFNISYRLLKTSLS